MALNKTQLENTAREHMLDYYKINENTKLVIVITKISKSGMTRRMRVYIPSNDLTKNQNPLIDISFYIKDLCDLSFNEKGLKVVGCGMDMTFWLADYITQSLWPNKDERKKLNFNGNGGSCLFWQPIY